MSEGVVLRRTKICSMFKYFIVSQYVQIIYTPTNKRTEKSTADHITRVMNTKIDPAVSYYECPYYCLLYTSDAADE